MGEVLGGRYELVDPLGEGGAGVVWRAWDRREQRFVAAKVMRQADAHSLLRFVREQAVRVEHRHVLTPLGWTGEDERVLLAMPIVTGGSVATLVGDHGPLPPVWVATLLDQLLQALERIHAQGLVHRDVKPANLLLDATGNGFPRLRLADFGIAAAVDQPRLTSVAHVVGTIGYAAPESLRAGWDPDPRADLYAVGMSAAEMLLGERPATEDSGVAQRPPGPGGGREGAGPEAALGRRLVRAHVPTPLVDVVLDLVATDPGRRLPDAATARGALRAAGLVADLTSWEPGDVEVLDHVPDLPPGWTGRGPDDRAGDDVAVRSAVARTSAAPQASRPEGEATRDPRTALLAGASTTPGKGGPATGEDEVARAGHEDQGGRERPHRWGAALLLVGLVLIAVALVLALLSSGGG